MSIVHGSVLQKWGFKPQGKDKQWRKNKLVAQTANKIFLAFSQSTMSTKINTHKR